MMLTQSLDLNNPSICVGWMDAHLATLFHAGSGQVIDQGARLVDIALEDGSAFKLDGWKYISESFANNTLHFIGLLSDGGVHSRYDQLIGFVKGAAKDGAKRIRVHILTVSILLLSLMRSCLLVSCPHLHHCLRCCRDQAHVGRK